MKSARVFQDDTLNHFGAGHLDAAKAVKLAAQGKSVSKISSGGYENGYLNLRFWFDGGAIAQDCNGTWFLSLSLVLRVYFPFGWTWSLRVG